MFDELSRLREAVETLERDLDEALALFRSGGVEPAPEIGEPAEPAADLVPPASEAVMPAPDDVAEVVAVGPGEPAAFTRKRRRRGLPKLIVIAVVLGLLIAGVAIGVSAVGWSELRDTFHIGSVGVYGGPA